MAALQLSSVTKRFGNNQIIHGVELTIKSGEFIVFVGPSGCGKSTLLRMIAGLETVTEGKIHIAERDVTDLSPSKRKIAMVFQSYALYPHMTVEQNLSFGMRMRKTDKNLIKQKVSNACEVLQLAPYLKRKPSELSGGQCQRVAIGRALVQDPDVFLFDEPLSNLDAELRVKMRLEIAELHKRLDSTMIYVTHDQTEAMTLADRIVVLRDGNIEQVGTPMELYINPNNQFVAGFIGSPKMNFLPVISAPAVLNNTDVVVVLDKQFSIKIKCQQGFLPSDHSELTLGIRPEHISLAADGQIKAVVSVIERLGATNYIYCRIHDMEICVQSDNHLPSVGEQVTLKIDESKAYLFDQQQVTINMKKVASEIKI